MKNILIKVMAIFVSLIALNACASSPTSQQSTGVKEIYEVHEDGRIHVFYDRKMYLDFLSLGETPYRLIKVGKGPNRETLVFGLAKNDKKKRGGIPAIDLYEGKGETASPFYAEVRKHGRIYVFNEFRDMQPVRQFGHPNYFYMEVGAGPGKETVFYVLNKKTKKKKPLALIDTFKKMNNL